MMDPRVRGNNMNNGVAKFWQTVGNLGTQKNSRGISLEDAFERVDGRVRLRKNRVDTM